MAFNTEEVIDLLQRYDTYVRAQALKEAWQRMKEEADQLKDSVNITQREIEVAILIKNSTI
jgi:polyhydroxyalkanoate synthesis regulator protein